MAHPIPTSEPVSVRAGDTATWTKSLSDYPANQSWVLSYTLTKTGTRITFTASASGADHLVAVAAATTAAWAAGEYTWAARVTKTTEAYTIATGVVEVLADIATITAGSDARSHAKITLDALEAWIEGRDMGVSEYEIAGRRLRTISIPDLLKLRDRYRRDVGNEANAARAGAGLPSRNKLQVRFGRPN